MPTQSRIPSLSGSAIKPEPNEFDDNFLNVIGNEFKFDHAKGLAEWMKNSADAYSTTAKVRDTAFCRRVGRFRGVAYRLSGAFTLPRKLGGALSVRGSASENMG